MQNNSLNFRRTYEPGRSLCYEFEFCRHCLVCILYLTWKAKQSLLMLSVVIFWDPRWGDYCRNYKGKEFPCIVWDVKRSSIARRFKCLHQYIIQSINGLTFEPPHDKTNKITMCPAKTQITWASTQSVQSLRCPHEEALGPLLPIERIARTLIRLGGLLVFSCAGSFMIFLLVTVIVDLTSREQYGRNGLRILIKY